MVIVLDTNVLFSALLAPHGWPDTVYRAWQKDCFDLVTSAAQKEVPQPYRVGTMVNNMRRSIMLDALPPLPEGIEVNDSNDAFLLAMALVSEAESLVNGDLCSGLLQRGSHGCTRIFTLVTFCAETL